MSVPTPGSILAGRYRLDARVGGGGMGVVWRATDLDLDRMVAVKTIQADLLEQPVFAERFLKEARAIATIRHRGVVTLFDHHRDTSGAFLVLEWIDGEDLRQRLNRQGTLDPAQTMTLVADASEALQAAHDKGVVHRDIKPANLLLPAGEPASGDVVMITDFGIARLLDATRIP